MPFTNFRNFVDAQVASGQVFFTSWRKVPTQAFTIGIWADLSMSPGNPPPQYYASSPLISSTIDSFSLPHGSDVSPKKKYLANLTAMCTATVPPLSLILCDYLLYYPFIDMGDSETTVINTVNLPRYTDGEGVKIIAVQVGSQVGGQNFYVTYTNQNGEAGRRTPTVGCSTQVTIGSIITSNRDVANSIGPFLPLQRGDTGVRSIESLTMIGVDVGLITLVLVKPIASMMIRGTDAPVEVDFLKDRPSLPVIEDGAYLNFLAMSGNGSFASIPINGTATFVWG